jgi:hypothetical protein
MKISRPLCSRLATGTVFSGVLFAALAMLSPSVSIAAVTHSCGAPIRSIVKTEIGGFTTSSTTFVNLPGAVPTINVPAGETQCVKVRFSAMVSCSQTGDADICSILVVEPGVVAFDPPFNGVNFIVENNNYEARSFEWVKELGAGSHTIRVLAGVQKPATVFQIPIWTLDIEQTK